MSTFVSSVLVMYIWLPEKKCRSGSRWNNLNILKFIKNRLTEGLDKPYREPNKIEYRLNPYGKKQDVALQTTSLAIRISPKKPGNIRCSGSGSRTCFANDTHHIADKYN